MMTKRKSPAEEADAAQKRIDLLANAPVLPALLKMTLPMVAAMLVQVLYNLVDTFFIGQMGQAAPLAAANLALPILMIMMAIASIFGTGGASFISRCLGENRREQANSTLTISILLMAITALFITAIGFIALTPLVAGMGADAEVFPYARDYAVWLFAGALFVMCNYGVGALLRAEGAAMPSMIGMLLGAVVNIALDPLFIFTFNLGVAGAAIATVLGNLASCAYFAYCYLGGKTLLKFKPKLFKWDKVIWGEIFKIGLPASLSQFLMSVATIVCNNIAAVYGVVMVAGYGVANKIMMIGTFVFMGYSAGCQPLVGYNFGAKNFQRVKKLTTASVLLLLGVGLVLGAIFYIIAVPLVSIFSTDQAVIQEGAIILRALVLSLPFMGSVMMASVAVQSMGKAVPSLLLSISRQGLLYVPLLLALNALFGRSGFIYAQPLTDVIMFVASNILILWLLKREGQRMATA